MKEEILFNLLGTNTIGFLVSFYLFALFGVLFSLVIHVKKKVSKTKFSWSYWFKDNLKRFLASIMVIFIVARFAPEMSLPFEANMFGAVILGTMLDRAIIYVRNKTTFNYFQSKK